MRPSRAPPRRPARRWKPRRATDRERAVGPLQLGWRSACPVNIVGSNRRPGSSAVQQPREGEAEGNGRQRPERGAGPASARPIDLFERLGLVGDACYGRTGWAVSSHGRLERPHGPSANPISTLGPAAAASSIQQQWPCTVNYHWERRKNEFGQQAMALGRKRSRRRFEIERPVTVTHPSFACAAPSAASSCRSMYQVGHAAAARSIC